MKGRAGVFTRVGRPLEIREYPLPALEPEAMLVKVNMANICGSDLHFARGLGPGVRQGIPQILGHEMMGRVVDQGKGATADTQGNPLRPGDRVVYAYFKACGRCAACLHGVPGCPHRYRHWLGVSCEDPAGLPRGLRRFLRPPAGPVGVPGPRRATRRAGELSQLRARRDSLRPPAGRDRPRGQRGDPGGRWPGALRRRRGPGEVGAGTIIAEDRVSARLEPAQDFGADYVIDAGTTEAAARVEQVRDLTRGGADVVAELAGSPAVLRHPFHRMLSHTFELGEINDAFAVASQGKAIRVGIVPR